MAETWPGPIAHEYHRLRELLTEGHIVPAIFQLKDLVEVMIKFPALVMARDLLQHGDQEAGRAARRVIVTLAAIEQAHVIYQLQVGAVMVFHLRQIVGYPCGLDLVRQ